MREQRHVTSLLFKFPRWSSDKCPYPNKLIIVVLDWKRCTFQSLPANFVRFLRIQNQAKIRALGYMEC